MLQKIMNRNLLKYSAGHHICCPKCDKIADYRQWVIWESPAGQHGAHCADCHREMLVKVHDDKPHAYLVSIGWQFNTLVDFDKKQRKPAQIPQKAGKALDTYLRRTIFAGLIGYRAKQDRLFPAESYAKPVEIIDTVTADGFDSCYAENAQYSAYQVAEYVAKYCELNHLKVA